MFIHGLCYAVLNLLVKYALSVLMDFVIIIIGSTAPGGPWPS